MADIFGQINSPLGSTMGQGVSWTPQQYLSYLEMLANSPQGQAASRAQQQTAEFQIKMALDDLKLKRDQLAISRGQAEADRWYKEQQVKLAQQAHQLAVQQQQWTQQYQTAGMTGMLEGTPTLANLAQQGQFTGYYNGSPTLAREGQEQQFGLQQGALTGMYQGAPTLANQQFQANTTGYLNGAPTLAREQWEVGQTGYLNGSPTMQRQQLAANTALQGAQLGASLQGPENWAQYINTANAIQGSPVSALLQTQPGGLGATNLAQTARPLTLGSVLGQMGITPQGAPPPVAPGIGAGQQVVPGTPAQFNEGGPVAGGNQQMAAQLQAAIASGQMTQEQAAQAWQQYGAQTGQYSGGQGMVRPGAAPVGSPAYAQPTEGIEPWQRPTGPVDPAALARARGDGINYAGGTPGWLRPGAAQQKLGNALANQGAAPASGRSNDAGFAYPFTGANTGMDPMGALAQVAQAPRASNAQLGLNDGEADTLKGWLASPNQAPTNWLESKSPTQRSYLRGLAQNWGFDPSDVESRYRSSRPRQASSMAA